MKKVHIILALIVLYFTRGNAAEIKWENISRELLDVRAIALKYEDPTSVYAGTGKGLYESEDGGDSWKPIVYINGQSHGVNFLVFDPEDKSILYAACANGLYCSRDSAKNWKRVFKAKNQLENNCTGLIVLPHALYLGTEGGLFASSDKGRAWNKVQGQLGKERILNLSWNRKDPNTIYVAAVSGVFKSMNRGEYWEKIFTASPVVDERAIREHEEEEVPEEATISSVRYVAVDPNRMNYVYVATSRGLYLSHDRGVTWEGFSSCALISKDMNFLLVGGESQIYAAGRSGIFAYEGERWMEVSLDLAAEDVRFMTLDKNGSLYAACEKGLFKARQQKYPPNNYGGLLSVISKGEPTINDVQREAIHYAEVDPQKISLWRAQAARRAILPKFTVGYDRDNNKTVGNSIWGTYGTAASTGKYYCGPDDETDYDDEGWSVSLSWDLGDLVWSEAQTSIDNRSKLMVQLRDDILDEVNKVYFERLRVKLELDNLALEERGKRAEKELRLRELTATLDGLTGGYFSHSVTGPIARK